MKSELKKEDIEAIAQRVSELLKSIIPGNGKQDHDVIFDVPGLADYLNVSKKWIYERTHLKEIPHYKKDGLLRFRKKMIDKWLDTCTVPAVSIPADGTMKAVKR